MKTLFTPLYHLAKGTATDHEKMLAILECTAFIVLPALLIWGHYLK